MSDENATPDDADLSRRKFLTVATAATGAVGAAFTLVPFIASWKPSERARALGAPLEIDVSKLEPGQMITKSWRKQPIYVVRRTPEALAKLGGHDGSLKDPQSAASDQPAYAKNAARSLKPEVLVLYAACTHLGCLPKQFFTVADPAMGADWPGGFFCPCHGSRFDLAGRVFNGSPASANLRVPPHKFESDSMLVIGVDATQGAA
ncbi:MAG: ubiquinol-cytochrome c reductase iron-sulfur subunit [Gammaproteobacteria bacterium]|nr:ubiquinol-cytochrome c reductase iron-sulfur subunit [Gammaproteobacteria bacterium]MBM4226100.1 ubiquinol-cytochrome c reductase iron-sulfur subunit [Gammaproteobacteria bacterium]MBM4229923.1 ubiquinol-cytochrome c reductase iron-sulfur subunit [Gammaproteobacteria bacterium]